MPPAPPVESAMATGQGSDDEPSLSIGDRHSGEAVPDPDGDRHLTSAKAASLLGAAPILPPIDGTNTIGDLDLSTLFGPPNVAVPERIASGIAEAALASYAIFKKKTENCTQVVLNPFPA